MIKFNATHRSLFDSSFQPFLIAMMKLFGAWMTEIANIFLICKQKDNTDVVMNFIALGIIAEIDNIYASRLFEFKCAKVLEEENLPIIHKGGIPGHEENVWIKLEKFLYSLFKLFFVSFYYYFAAFLPVLLSASPPPKGLPPCTPCEE